MRWLHCSDFHVGKDRTAQERLLDKIVGHVREQAARGFVPDLVFITGDVANRGLRREYDTFRKDFIEPLKEALGGDHWPGRVLARGRVRRERPGPPRHRLRPGARRATGPGRAR